VINLRQSQDDPSKDNGVEDTNEGDAKNDPQRDKSDFPRPRNQPGFEAKIIINYVWSN
jgi:hypothetical protein